MLLIATFCAAGFMASCAFAMIRSVAAALCRLLV